MTISSRPVDLFNDALKRVPVLPLYFVALVPGVWTFWQAVAGQLGADPMRALEQALGLWALRFMLATLAVTPLLRWPGLRLLRFRRMLGLTVFWYALAHLVVYQAPSGYLCVEPASHLANALARPPPEARDAMRCLDPGETLSATVTLALMA